MASSMSRAFPAILATSSHVPSTNQNRKSRSRNRLGANPAPADEGQKMGDTFRDVVLPDAPADPGPDHRAMPLVGSAGRRQKAVTAQAEGVE